jgi:hypothetical protein
MVRSSEAFVTLLTKFAFVFSNFSDDYGIGAIVLAHSLKESKTEKSLVCMVTEKVSPLMQGRLKGFLLFGGVSDVVRCV